MSDPAKTASTRPYLIRALHEWCGDNGLTPYIAVRVDESVQVPREFVKDGEIVLNISSDATSALRLDNEFISFKARFAGAPREVIVPVGRVMAIYARENGQGMAFPPEEAAAGTASVSSPDGAAGVPPADQVPSEPGRTGLQLAGRDGGESEEPPPERPAGGGGRPVLKRVK